MYPGLLNDLAATLGCSTEALEALGVGYHIKDAAYVFPERDTKGTVIGLLKRYPDGKKYMVESSKRGLIYAINPNYGEKYENILSGFIRVSESGTVCPICGKRDWCLISRSGDSSTPDKVICPRPIAEQGAIRRIGDAGWLHYFNDTKPVKSHNLLLDTNKPYLVVEGATDVLAAHDLGFVGVGRPSAEGGIQLIRKLLAGKRAIVIGENDSGAGERGMEACFEQLKRVCKKVSKVMPPAGTKDLREWVANGLTDKAFFEYLRGHANTHTDDKLLKSVAPLEIAEQWLTEKHTNGIHLLFRGHRNEWWQYDKGRYKKVYEALLDQDFYNYLDGKYYLDKDKKPTGYSPTKRRLRDIQHALLRTAQIRNGPNTDEPFIIQGCKSDIVFDRQRCIVFKNGILNIETEKLMSLSPEFFITSTLPFDYDPEAICALWERCLGEWFSEDPESIRLLCQWFGYNLIATNHLEKMMFLYGLPGSGKSTVTMMLHAMLGMERCTVVDFKMLTDKFSMEHFIGKYAAVFSEQQDTKGIDTGQILQIIKRFTGRNRLSIAKKFIQEIYTTLPYVRLTYECNELPRFNDNSQSLQRRVVMLSFLRSFQDHPNVHLKDQLMEELPGIANWALKGLADLLKTDVFTHPDRSAEAEKELRAMTCPVAAMADECFSFFDINAVTSCDQLFDLHRAWFGENGFKLYNRTWFFRVFINAFPSLKKCKTAHGDQKLYSYRGVIITPEAYKRYLGHP